MKTSYAAAAVALASGSWTFSDALIGTTFSDRFNGLKSARIRAGCIRMDFDKTTGAGIVTVNAALYGIDTGATFLLEKSTYGGVTFTTVPGGPATLTNTLMPYTFTVNQAGNVRFRITNTLATTVRISIDDISITNYTTPAPAISSFSPASGLPGTVVTVTGTNFTGATAFALNGAAVTGFTVVNATQLTFTVPAVATSGTIAVTTPTGTGTSAASFTVLVPNPVPVITSITPNTASVGAATPVTITGTGFTAASVVNADGNPIASTFVSATQITGTVPAGAPAGVYSITVVNPTPGGGTSNAITFTLTNPVPTITSFTPTSGGGRGHGYHHGCQPAGSQGGVCRYLCRNQLHGGIAHEYHLRGARRLGQHQRHHFGGNARWHGHRRYALQPGIGHAGYPGPARPHGVPEPGHRPHTR